MACSCKGINGQCGSANTKKINSILSKFSRFFPGSDKLVTKNQYLSKRFVL
jgi:hypothetical protein